VFTVSSNEMNEKGEKEHFFKSPKYLTVSTQLHLEALAAAVPRVWTLSPTFRAERSDTHRHLSEFYMLEAEVSFVETMDPLLDLIEDMIRHLVTGLAGSRVGHEILSQSGDLKPQLEERWQGLVRPDRWKRLTYTSTIEVLQAAIDKGEKTFQFAPTWGASLQSEHEKYLAELYNGPVFVTDYPRDIKPFYMLPSAGDDRTVACFDLLFPAIGELIGGSLREYRYDELVQSMKAHGLIPADGDAEQAGLKWYTDLRKWGTAPHGGFGMGLDRLLCYLTGVENIREVVAFPRWVGRCDA
jgi:asparaginyl-tRNA synthetase